MILVPYFIDKVNPDWTSLGIFLCNGGRAVWDLDESDTDSEITAMLLENGFPIIQLRRSGTTIFAEVDFTRLKMDHFYIWSEINHTTSEKDVWRIFKIPNALWSCLVFKEQYWKSVTLPFDTNLIPAI